MPQEFQRAVQRAPYRDRDLITFQSRPGTNGSKWMLHVIACPSDIPVTEGIVADLNAKADK